MNKDYCDITLLLDKSGSMEHLKSDTIGGVNSFIDDQKKLGGKCRISLYQFDDEYETTYENADIEVAPRLNDKNYSTRGWTALLDAIGRTINSVGDRLNKLNENDKPSKVILVIQTDGHENRSKEFTREQIASMVKHQQNKYNWNFIFLGANQDAITVGTSYGFSASNSMTYSANAFGTSCMYKSVSSNISGYRRSSDSADLSFSKKDREIQEKELNKSLTK